jgi:hypothetical protein
MIARVNTFMCEGHDRAMFVYDRAERSSMLSLSSGAHHDEEGLLCAHMYALTLAPTDVHAHAHTRALASMCVCACVHVRTQDISSLDFFFLPQRDQHTDLLGWSFHSWLQGQVRLGAPRGRHEHPVLFLPVVGEGHLGNLLL